MLDYKPTLIQVHEAIRLHQLWLEGTGGVCACFIGCNLSGIQLEGVTLDYAHLDGCNLSRANLAGASFKHAWLTGANFTEADLMGATMEEAGCAFLNLTGAKIEGLDLTNAFTHGMLTDSPELSRSLNLVSAPTVVTTRGFALPAERFIPVPAKA